MFISFFFDFAESKYTYRTQVDGETVQFEVLDTGSKVNAHILFAIEITTCCRFMFEHQWNIHGTDSKCLICYSKQNNSK